MDSFARHVSRPRAGDRNIGGSRENTGDRLSGTDVVLVRCQPQARGVALVDASLCHVPDVRQRQLHTTIRTSCLGVEAAVRWTDRGRRMLVFVMPERLRGYDVGPRPAPRIVRRQFEP